MATKRNVKEDGEVPPTENVPVVKKKRAHVMTASEERKQGAINMIAGIMITLLILYVLHSVGSLIPKLGLVDIDDDSNYSESYDPTQTANEDAHVHEDPWNTHSHESDEN